MIPPLVRNNRPAFYFVRLDTISELSGHNWLLITFIPDDAKVRTKEIIFFLVCLIKTYQSRFVKKCYMHQLLPRLNVNSV